MRGEVDEGRSRWGQACVLTYFESGRGLQTRVTSEQAVDCVACASAGRLAFQSFAPDRKGWTGEKTSALYLQRIAWLIPNVRASQESLSSDLMGATVPSVGSREIPNAADIDSSLRF